MGNRAFFEFVGFVACENGIAICRPEIETQGEEEDEDEGEGVAELCGKGKGGVCYCEGVTFCQTA